MPKFIIIAAVAGLSGIDCFVRLEPEQPAAMAIAMMAGMKAYVSYMCSTLKPKKDINKDNNAMMTMPALGLTAPSEIAEMHCPPMTQMIMMKPVMVARLSKTGIETRYRLMVRCG